MEWPFINESDMNSSQPRSYVIPPLLLVLTLASLQLALSETTSWAIADESDDKNGTAVIITLWNCEDCTWIPLFRILLHSARGGCVLALVLYDLEIRIATMIVTFLTILALGGNVARLLADQQISVHGSGLHTLIAAQVQLIVVLFVLFLLRRSTEPEQEDLDAADSISISKQVNSSSLQRSSSLWITSAENQDESAYQMYQTERPSTMQWQKV